MPYNNIKVIFVGVLMWTISRWTKKSFVITIGSKECVNTDLLKMLTT